MKNKKPLKAKTQKKLAKVRAAAEARAKEVERKRTEESAQ
jgi:hypothetical protein